MNDHVWLVSYYALSTVQNVKSSSIKTASEYVFLNPVTVFVYGMRMFPQCLKVWIICNSTMIFYIHGSVHRESNLIIVQQDATVFSLLHSCRKLYMFRALTPIIRSSYSCNYSLWDWSTGYTTIRSRCWFPTQQRERMAVDPVNQYQKL